MHADILNKFNKHARRGNDDECWPWQGTIDKDGYGVLLHQGRQVRAHRVSLAAVGWPVPRDRNALHHCDNRSCVNPRHLYVGTHGDNVADRVWRDRSAKGEANGRAKLTEARVLVILAQHEAGVSQRRLAARFGVSVRTIHNIINRKAWNHVGSQYDLL